MFVLSPGPKGMESDNATGYASSSSSNPTGTPCYDNAEGLPLRVKMYSIVIHMFSSLMLSGSLLEMTFASESFTGTSDIKSAELHSLFPNLGYEDTRSVYLCIHNFVCSLTPPD